MRPLTPCQEADSHELCRQPASTGNLKPQLTAIVAMTADRVIGRDGSLPWQLPDDLAFFKRTTSGHPVVMGRKTYESIGRPLPKRRNIVLTRDPVWSAAGVEVIHKPEDLSSLPELEGRVFIIGGSEIYTAFMPMIDELLVSHVFATHKGDTHFPEFEKDFPKYELLETHATFEVRRWRRDFEVGKRNTGKQQLTS
jgi:dihydrofolate reductase